MKQRAYSTLEIKASQEAGGKRTFKGIASTPTTDRMGDIVEPKGAIFKLPLPLLWQHDHRDPIGWVTSAKVTDKGIEIEGEVATVPPEEAESELGKRLLKAWQMLKSKLVRGLSIGFNPIESAQIEGTWSYRFLSWEWLELSAVTIAANGDASITSIKAADLAALRAASGNSQGSRGGLPSPGVAGSSKAASGGNPQTSRPKGNAMKKLAELLQAKEQKLARQKEIVTLLEDKSTPPPQELLDECDELETELKELETDIRIARFHERNAEGAREVRGASAGQGSGSRGNGAPFVQRQKDKEDAFPGQSFVRTVIARAMALQTGDSPVSIAQKRWGRTNPQLVEVIRAAVAGGGTGSGEWGAELAEADTRYTGDFVEFLYGMTVYDKLGLREVPENVLIKGQDGGGTGYWVGESKAIPATALDFFNVELKGLKAAALAVLSNDLIRLSDPAAEILVRNGLAEASAQRIDLTFLSDNAASAGVSPAGIFNGVAPIGTAGNSADNLRTDIKRLYAPFITAKNATGLTLVMNPSTAKALSLMVNALGQPEFPGLTAAGGTLLGDRVVVGDNVDPSIIALVKPSDIWRIGGGGVEVAVSREAMIEQDNAPTGATDTPTAATATFTSMFQEDSSAYRVIRRIAFQKRRASAVSWINNADYDGVVS